jgi:hypothetical protein
MQPELENQIYDNLVTNEDVAKLLKCIDLLLNTMYQNDTVEFDRVLNTECDVWFSEIVRNLDVRGVEKGAFLKNISKKIKGLDEIIITIHKEPNERLKEAVKSWIDANLGTKVIANFENKKSILGGAIISYKGKYVDYSLEKRLNSVIAVMKPQLMKSLVTTGTS